MNLRPLNLTKDRQPSRAQHDRQIVVRLEMAGVRGRGIGYDGRAKMDGVGQVPPHSPARSSAALLQCKREDSFKPAGWPGKPEFSDQQKT